MEVPARDDLTPVRDERSSTRSDMASKTNKNVLELDDESFDAAVLSSALPVLVDFGATWCQPCKALEPIVDALADEGVGRYVVAKVDIDAAPGVAKRYGIRGAPTLLVFRDGKKTAQHLGLTSKAKLLELIASGG